MAPNNPKPELELVVEFQHVLAALGDFTGACDGELNDETRSALANCRAKYALAANADITRGSLDVLLRAADRDLCLSARQVQAREANAINPARKQLKATEVTVGRDPEVFVGLAFSGGGIRSATFNLGVLQALAHQRLLGLFDYLSTVSGGGYIGSWFSALLKRHHRGDITALEGELAPRDAPVGKREPSALMHLRRYSNYLTPRPGVMSADTWAIVATYLRNSFLNLLILVLFLAAILMLPRIAALGISAGRQSISNWFATGVALFGAATFLVALNLAHESLPRLKNPWYAHQGFILSTIVIGTLFLGAFFGAAWLAFGSHTITLDATLVGYGILLGLFYAGLWAGGWVVETWLYERRRQRVLPKIGQHTQRLYFYDPLREERTMRQREVRDAAGVARFLAASVAAFVVGCMLIVGLTKLFHYVTASDAAIWHIVTLGAPSLLAVAGLTVVLQLGLQGRYYRDASHEWWSRFGAWCVLIGIGWLALCSIAIYAPALALAVPGASRSWLSGALASGWLLSTLGGLLAGHSESASGEPGKKTWLDLAGLVAPYVFIVGALILVSLGLHLLLDGTIGGRPGPAPSTASASGGAPQSMRLSEHLATMTYSLNGGLLGVFAILVVLTFALSWRVDINKFSLYQMYRNRLVRAYLGASNRRRLAQPFTNFDEDDELRMSDIGSSWAVAQRPYHIVNTALNLLQGKELAWQERRAASFVFAPLFSGYALPAEAGDQEAPAKGADEEAHARSADEDVKAPAKSADEKAPAKGAYEKAPAKGAGAGAGADVKAPAKSAGARGCFRPTALYGGEAGGFLLGQALTVSGAAASPSMGYHSSAPLSFLLTLFNVRLGRWCANTRESAWRVPSPRLGFWCLLQELFGLTDKSAKFVYLSDGGHFDNLAIYELVRRQCRYIVAIDAGQDGAVEFEDLGNAIRKCYTDFGVTIDIDVNPIRKQANGFSQWHCAVGTINYANAPDGTLLYIKPSLTGNEPTDILNYASRWRAFPHQSTNDQWFDESQFESYRKLGQHIAEAIFRRAKRDAQRLPGAARDNRSVDAEGLFVALRENWRPAPQGTDGDETALRADLERLYNEQRKDRNLRFLDEQIYPEWRYLAAENPGAIQRLAWLPEHEDERRAGFYFCNHLLDVMETAFDRLNLDEEFDHPDHRGWINLFKHWSWSGMLRITFAMSAGTYSTRFQNFCERLLGLEIGKVVATPVEQQAERSNAQQLRDDARLKNYLNFLEAGLVAELREQGEAFDTIWAFTLCVTDPSDKSASTLPSFPFGFAVLHGSKIIYFRVQDHLRQMGLARRALRELCARQPRLSYLNDRAPKLPPTTLEPISKENCERFARIFSSVVC